jgi:hypothetical protein
MHLDAPRPRLPRRRHALRRGPLDPPSPRSPARPGHPWGTPEALRRLAALATQAAIQAEEEACWHAHQATRAAPQHGRVA